MLDDEDKATLNKIVLERGQRSDLTVASGKHTIKIVKDQTTAETQHSYDLCNVQHKKRTKFFKNAVDLAELSYYERQLQEASKFRFMGAFQFSRKENETVGQ